MCKPINLLDQSLYMCMYINVYIYIYNHLFDILYFQQFITSSNYYYYNLNKNLENLHLKISWIRPKQVKTDFFSRSQSIKESVNYQIIISFMIRVFFKCFLSLFILYYNVLFYILLWEFLYIICITLIKPFYEMYVPGHTCHSTYTSY